MPIVYFRSSSPPRLTVEKGGGGGSSHISAEKRKQIIERFNLIELKPQKSQRYKNNINSFLYNKQCVN